MVFNPSFVDRFTHTVMGCYLTGSLLVVSVAAFYLLKGRHTDYAKMSMKIGLVIATIAALGQLLLGHNSAVGVAENQPAKMAAMEGHYNSGEPMDLALIGWYDEEANEVKGISIPGAGTALLMWSPLDPFSIDMDTPVTGLDQFAEEDRPPVEPVFQSYHVMVAIGMFLIAMTLVASFMMFKGTLWTSKWMLSTLVGAVVLPHLANFTGWMTAEIGRQPWVVYNLLRTEDALSPAVSGGEVLTSLIMFALVYALLFSLFLYLLDKKIKGGPTEPDEHGLVEEERKAKVIGGEAS
jgi:cytochrome d ubiquinol oxidase subunit I